MESGQRKCFRCKGAKNIYQVGSCYSLINTGGKLVKCPMCLGEGKIKTLEQLIDSSDKQFDALISAQEITSNAIESAIVNTKTELMEETNHDKQEAVTSKKDKGSKGKK